MTNPETVDPALVTELADATRAVPGVRDAVAVVRHGARADASVAAQPARAPEPAAPADTGKPSSHVVGGELRIPDGAPMTLQEALRQAAELAPDKGTVFVSRDSDAVLQTYPELLAEAERVLGGLRAAGLRPGDAVLFQFDDNQAYLTAFWACVLGGFVPTPVAVAATYESDNAINRRLYNAWKLLDHPAMLTTRATAPALAEVRTLWDEPDVRLLVLEELAEHAPDGDWFPTAPDTPVVHLLTSGSTGVPKCVQHTNASVAARTWSWAQAREYTEDDVTVNWMPLDHVAIIMYNVRDTFLRCLHVNARTDHFLADPLALLDWMDTYRGTNTLAPNFACAMINDRAEEIAGRSWDLSCVRDICNAAEPVVAATSRRFLEVLAPHRLPADAMWPAWGMSETCSAVTCACQHRDDPAAATVVVAQSSLGADIRFVDPAEAADDTDAVPFSSVGPPTPGVEMRIVDEDGAVLPEDRMGELQIRGVTMMRGYHNNAKANEESYDSEGWFRTGDLAFVHERGVVIAGRKKDQIVVRGINYIAHEIESVVEQVDGVRLTHVAAAGLREPGEGSDRLAIFFVPLRWEADDLAGIVQDVRSTLVREVGLAPDLIVPVTANEFPKTGSGKIQRGILVADLRAGRFADRLAAADDAAAEPATWFFERRWARLPEQPGDAGDAGDAGVRVVFAEDEVLPHLGLDGTVVAVGRGAEFAEEAPDRFRVVAGDPDHVRRVLARVSAVYGPIGTVVFGWPLPAAAAAGDPAERLTAVSAELSSLVQALADGEFGRPLLLALSTGAVHTRPGDRIDLAVCALPGLIRTAVTEDPHSVIRQADLPDDRSQWAAAVRTEVADRTSTGVLAVREGSRWQPRLRPVAEADAGPEAPVTAGGTYLVTGGLGGIAHDLAGYLLAAYGARLLLVGRSPATGEKADRLAELADLGQVRYQQVDVADARALAAAVAEAEEAWGGPLDGVLHLAGGDPSGQWAELERHTLARETAETFADLYRAKVAGTLAIAEVLESRPKASLVLFGSVNGEFGGHSFGAYSAANTFLVGFADHWRHERGRDVRCLAWSQWTNVGMNQGQSTEPARRRGFLPISPEEGLRSFLTATALPHGYLLIGLDLANPLIVSELDAEELRAQEVLVAYTADGTDVAAVRKALEPAIRRCPVPVRLAEVADIPRDASGRVDLAQLLLDGAPKRHRRTEYIAPANDLERQIAAIWSDVLGRESVGREDSFFELGGNSLRATRLLARVSDELSVRLSTHELYQNPTVASLAATITTD
ncbi:SDR family NAD(P)-dependent oxidoreductase [Streptomyces sp. P1-3]|uniref:SDR family NAD(P)-dependent oxidoreductase n=1 Tax=Streptomyces sp. P1-3 TaxID=3421658 RepID=UPI003D36B2C3